MEFETLSPRVQQLITMSRDVEKAKFFLRETVLHSTIKHFIQVFWHFKNHGMGKRTIKNYRCAIRKLRDIGILREDMKVDEFLVKYVEIFHAVKNMKWLGVSHKNALSALRKRIDKIMSM